MKRDFDIDGFLAYACDAIYVDQFQLERRRNRYHFTLAHELSHLLLHKDLYENESIRDLQGYLNFMAALDKGDLNNYEWQANNLAGRILLPEKTFVEACRECFIPLKQQIPDDVDKTQVCFHIAEQVADQFEVSGKVAYLRLWNDGLSDQVGV